MNFFVFFVLLIFEFLTFFDFVNLGACVVVGVIKIPILIKKKKLYLQIKMIFTQK